MSAQTTPLYSMAIPSSEALLREMTEQLANVQKAQTQNKSHYQNWKAVAHNPSGHDPIMGGNMLFSFLLEGLFGLPIFSGISDMTHGMAQMGAMQLSDQSSNTRKVADPYDLDMTSRAYRRSTTHNAAQEKQLEMWQQMAMMLIMMMMQQIQQQQGESGKGGEELIPDALRHPKMARFKQNRASISCIRSMFQRQADVVTPRYTAPKYMCA